jgi:putative N6-adenine-specific DNA methylase
VARAGQPTRLTAFAACAPGTERLASAEIRALGARVLGTEPGGVTVACTERQLYAAHLWCRCVTRWVVRVATFRATSFAALEAGAARVEWERWLLRWAPEPALVRASAHRSKLIHTGAIEERVSGALEAGGELGGAMVLARIVDDEVTLSVDASGELLHKRGWRQDVGEAPLRETMAASLLAAIGWDGSLPLADPLCGAGTIAIEAARLARRMPACLEDRPFAFQAWPSFQPGTWASVRGEATSRVLPSAGVAIVASDRDPAAVAAAKANARRAGVADDIEVRQADASTFTSDEPAGWLVTNPPYGRRLSGSARLAVPPGWGLAVLHPDALPDAEQALRLRNGGIPVSLWKRAPSATVSHGT